MEEQPVWRNVPSNLLDLPAVSAKASIVEHKLLYPITALVSCYPQSFKSSYLSEGIKLQECLSHLDPLLCRKRERQEAWYSAILTRVVPVVCVVSLIHSLSVSFTIIPSCHFTLDADDIPPSSLAILPFWEYYSALYIFYKYLVTFCCGHADLTPH